MKPSELRDQALLLWDRLRRSDPLNSKARTDDIVALVNKVVSVVESELKHARQENAVLRRTIRAVCQQKATAEHNCIACGTPRNRKHKKGCKIGAALEGPWHPIVNTPAQKKEPVATPADAEAVQVAQDVEMVAIEQETSGATPEDH